MKKTSKEKLLERIKSLIEKYELEAKNAKSSSSYSNFKFMKRDIIDLKTSVENDFKEDLSEKQV
jgi:hypothetical protein